MPPKNSDGSTKEKLLEAAKKEFMQNGFLKASLRTICKNAGVTTGALYFFFHDKEDLFDSIVKPVIDQVTQIMAEHFSYESTIIKNGNNSLMHILEKESANTQNTKSDLSTAIAIFRFLYSHYDEFILIMKKSQGTKWEGLTSYFVDWNFKHLKSLADDYCKAHAKKKIKPFVLRMVSNSQINCFMNIILNIPSCTEAEKYLPAVMHYLVGGWCTLFDENI